MSYLNERFIWVLLLLVTASPIACVGETPIHGMLKRDFAAISICDREEATIDLKNEEFSDLVIEGAAISLGTDPDGNFTLGSLTIGNGETGNEEIPAVNGIIGMAIIPSGTSYSFKVTYSPYVANSASTALLDIAYREPRGGLIQVLLSGSSLDDTSSCPEIAAAPAMTAEEEAQFKGRVAAALSGPVTLQIQRIALVTPIVAQPITTDPENTKDPYFPFSGPVTFDLANHALSLGAIPVAAEFKIPPTKEGPLTIAIPGDITVTTTAPITGSFDLNGNILFENVPLHLSEGFETDLTISLSTGEVLADGLPTKLLRSAGFPFSGESGKISGVPLSFKTFETTLVGVSTFSNTSGDNLVGRTANGAKAALLIKVKLIPQPPSPPPPAP